jgi:SAM-dependent methyltransferase
LAKTARCAGRGSFREGVREAAVGLINWINLRFHHHSAPRYLCGCCGTAGYAFVHLSNRLRIAWHSACPGCDSRSRHRGLALLIPETLGNSAGRRRVLHFAPEAVLRNVLLQLPNVEYRTTDLFVEDVDYPSENIEALSFQPCSFDVVLCNHVLEHVANDAAAVRELARILAPSGVAIITIPGEWTRQKTITFPNTDLNGHYRDYGLEVKDLLQRHFAAVELVDMHALDRAPNGLSYGIRPRDVAFICRQPCRLEGLPNTQSSSFAAREVGVLNH